MALGEIDQNISPFMISLCAVTSTALMFKDTQRKNELMIPILPPCLSQCMQCVHVFFA